MVRLIAAFVWGLWSMVLLHPLWYAAVDGPAWVGPVDVVGTWDAPWWIRHSFVPFWFVSWVSSILAVRMGWVGVVSLRNRMGGSAISDEWP